MSEEQMIYCLIAFVLGWLLSRQVGNGFSVGCGFVDIIEDVTPLDNLYYEVAGKDVGELCYIRSEGIDDGMLQTDTCSSGSNCRHNSNTNESRCVKEATPAGF